jgi:hypothetical protein
MIGFLDGVNVHHKCGARGVLSNIYALFVERGLKNVMNAWKEKPTDIATKKKDF